jgi:hypothetical protein
MAFANGMGGICRYCTLDSIRNIIISLVHCRIVISYLFYTSAVDLLLRSSLCSPHRSFIFFDYLKHNLKTGHFVKACCSMHKFQKFHEKFKLILLK